MMLTPGKTSPFGLIQEELRDEPWKMLIACMMLNLTNIKQVRPVIVRFFEKYPTAEAAAAANPQDLAKLLQPLGLFNRRSKTIIGFSKAWLRGDWKKLSDLPGIGKYAEDSYNIFVEGTLNVTPSDVKLLKYIDWAMCEGNRDGEAN